MKKFLLLALFAVLSFGLKAQISVKDGSFKEIGQFYTMKEDMTDDNYAPFAVIRINTENMTEKQVAKLGFQGDARTFFDVEFHEKEVWVYLTYLATYLKITHPDLSSTEFTIPYDMEPLKGYEIVLVNGAASPTGGRGSLTVTTIPEGASLLISGISMGSTPYFNDLMAVGHYEIEVSMKDYQTTTRTVDIADKADVKVEINMERSNGTLKVETDPAGASVIVDGVKYGVTPLIIKTLRTGKHVLRLEKENYIARELDIIIHDFKETEFFCSLGGDIEKKSVEVKGAYYDMRKVKGGTYIMGATPEQMTYAKDNEKPAHQVTVNDFYIGKFEVTEDLWYAVMEGKKPNKNPHECWPMSAISWNDVQKFIKKLNKITKSKFRLPTEAEWQYAARGGIYSDGTVYSGSNNLSEVGWYKGNADRGRHPIVYLGNNGLGIYDMSGNVWEFCSDYYGNYSSGKQINPQGPATGDQRVIVGGGFPSDEKDCRVTSRKPINQDARYNDVGFRLVLEP